LSATTVALIDDEPEVRPLTIVAAPSVATALLEPAGRIIGESPAMLSMLETARRLATRDITVLVRGETGTGKELVASFLHAHSARAPLPLVVINAATIPIDLAESHFFGHEKGSFTGAIRSHDGYFVQADRGTLFIDEVAELPLALQAKLLRVLQEREVQPIGSRETRRIDVRVIAATHRDLAVEVNAGRFREDLYYRLNVVELLVPALRDRRCDISLLAVEFVRKCSLRFGLGYVPRLSPEFMSHLERQPWDGNVRELENTIARAVALTTTETIERELLPQIEDGASTSITEPSLREQVDAFERGLLTRAITMSSGNQVETARRLQLTRATLYDKVKKHGLMEFVATQRPRRAS
jgi:DNA-binding NtrC family response regulator